MKKSLSSAIGWPAALSIAVETIVFAFSLIWGVIFHTEFDKNLGYIASFFLAPSIVVMMACFYDSTREQLKIFGLLALVASTIYAPLCMANYFLQLSIVALNPLNLSGEVLKAIAFEPGSPTFAMDMLGYGFLCLSTLAAGFALVEARDRILRALCFLLERLPFPHLRPQSLAGYFDQQAVSQMMLEATSCYFGALFLYR